MFHISNTCLYLLNNLPKTLTFKVGEKNVKILANFIPALFLAMWPVYGRGCF